jgi:hypothetical protein
MPTSATSRPWPSLWPPENRTRGTLLALLVIPATVLAWVIVWTVGWFIGVIAAGVGVGALALYALGSGGRVSFNAAFRITAITVVTLPIAYIAGFVSVEPVYFVRVLRNGEFIRGLEAEMSRYDAASIVLPLVFMAVSGTIGLIAVFRVAFAQQQDLKVASIVIDPYA